MNEMDIRKKMLEELMGQMDNRQMSRIQPQQPGVGMPPMVGEPDMDNMGGAPDGDQDELTRRLRQAQVGSVRG